MPRGARSSWPPLHVSFSEDLGTYRGVCACAGVVSLSCSPWKCCRWSMLIPGRPSAIPPVFRASSYLLSSMVPLSVALRRCLRRISWFLFGLHLLLQLPLICCQLSLFCLLPYYKDLLESLGCYHLCCHSLILTPKDYFLKILLLSF